MSKKGLPTSVQMRHDLHYVEELARPNRSIGKILPIDKIEPNPEQPRTEIGDLNELTESIKQNGVLEPLLVKPNRVNQTWMIIAGERRWRASNLAGLREVPCIELDLDEKSIAEIALIENLQRKDLTIWEEADGLAALKEKFGYTQEEIAKKISKSRTTVTESLTIAGLPEAIREKARESKITAKSTLLEIARQFDEKAMHLFLDKITENGGSREQARQNARTKKNNDPKITSEKFTNKVFRYISESKDFNLEIRFNHLENFQKRDVLKALKEAFETTKDSA
ncbi:MAG TPA: ParB/RepB/Spo0J family partition protein [Pyrinomonadaceae bacterium]|nr:ParB/RepB/Spo0J family partition protein [Pyrinomonadaceae bacterium]